MDLESIFLELAHRRLCVPLILGQTCRFDVPAGALTCKTGFFASLLAPGLTLSAATHVGRVIFMVNRYVTNEGHF